MSVARRQERRHGATERQGREEGNTQGAPRQAYGSKVAGHELLSGGVGAAHGDRGHSGRHCLHVLGPSGPNRATRRSC